MAWKRQVDGDRIVRRYRNKMSIREIARREGCSECTVRYYLRAAGIRFEPLDIGKIIALARAGWKIHDIAADAGCSEAEVLEVIGSV